VIDEPDRHDDGELRDRAPGRTDAGPLLTGLLVLLIVVLGTPQVWADLHSSELGLESVFFPVLAVAFACLAVSQRAER
jgi:hypothetical protein